MIKEKLKILNDKLRSWNIEVYGILYLEMESALKELNDLDNFVANGLVLYNGNVVDSCSLTSIRVLKILKYKESMLRQKSRHK